MIMIRKVEQQLALGRKDGLIRGPVHLGAGQEAVAVGVSESLQSTDRIFGTHRSHSHLMALNPDFYRLFAEVLGKQTGFSRGMGGSMHLWDKPSGFYGCVPIVSGTVALAVGAGMAAKLQNLDDIGVVYLGDGALEEGVVHESLNLARMQKAPVLFVLENNLFASHMHVSLRQPSDLMTRFAVANDIPNRLVEGNNVVAVAQISPDDNGKFVTEFKIGSTWSENGFYTISALQAMSQSSLYNLKVLVEVTNGMTEKTSATESNLVSDSFVVIKPSVIRDAGLEIYADAVIGSTTIEITGSTDRVSADITLTVTAPNGNVVSIDQVSPMLNGEFTSVITTGGPLWKQDGFYTVTAQQFDSPKYIASTEVDIQDGVVVPEFGTIAAMILAVAIISIIAISAKSRLSIMPRY